MFLYVVFTASLFLLGHYMVTLRWTQWFSQLGAGTFLYVAFMEVLPRELDSSNHRVLKMAMLLLGFGLMSLLAIWA